jgi:DNA-binding IclR family transcriptional regulator
VHGPTSRINIDQSAEFLPALREAAEQISQTLDW